MPRTTECQGLADTVLIRQHDGYGGTSNIDLRPRSRTHRCVLKTARKLYNRKRADLLRKFPDNIEFRVMLLLCSFLAMFDIAGVISNYTKIASSFDRLKDASWIAMVGPIGAAILEPVYSNLALRYERSHLLLVASVLFMLGSILFAASLSFETAILSRIIQVTGQAGFNCLVVIILRDYVPLRNVGYLETAFEVFNTLGLVIGSFAAEAIERKGSWRNFFAIDIGISFAIIIWISARYNKSKPSDQLKQHREPLERYSFDFPGAILLTTTTLTIVACVHGYEVIKLEPSFWQDILQYVAAVLVQLIFLVQVESKASSPIIPYKLLLKHQVVLVILACVLWQSWFHAILYSYPKYEQLRRYKMPDSINLGIGMMYLGIPLGSLLSGFLVRHGYHSGLLMFIANISGAAVAIFLTIFSNSIQPFQIADLSLILFGAFRGFFDAAALVLLYAPIKRKDHPLIIGLNDTVNLLGIAITIEATSSLVYFVVGECLMTTLSSQKIVEHISNLLQKDLGLLDTLEPNLKDIGLRCFETALELNYLSAAIAAILAAIASFRLWCINQEFLDEQAQVPDVLEAGTEGQ